MIYARQSTAIIVTVGPVLDADGVAVTTAVVGDFKISKAGGAPAALNGSATLTHRNTGHYSLSLTATDVNTVGTAEVVIDKTTDACPPKEIQVIEEAIYDAMFAASANAWSGAAGSSIVAANVTQFGGGNGTFASGRPEVILGDVVHGGENATLQLDSLAVVTVGYTTLTVTTNNLPWNAAWDTEVQSEVADELQSRGYTSTVSGRIDAAISTVATQTSVNDIPTNAELATAIITGLTTALTEGYRATGATGSVRDLLYEILQNLTEFDNAATTKTVKKLDGSTTAKTYTYDDANSPTSISETT